MTTSYRTSYSTIAEAEADGWTADLRLGDKVTAQQRFIGYDAAGFARYAYPAANSQCSTLITFAGGCSQMFRAS
jgi:hypothetical protein